MNGRIPIAAGLLFLAAPLAHGRDLGFEERVRAQEAIARVHHAHQIGMTKRFEQAVPRSVLEAQVRRYLAQTVALEELWHTAIDGPMLAAEVERMRRGTRMPGRLRELFLALGDDGFLVQECLARATLADRLARNFLAGDARIQAAPRARAEGIRAALASGELDPRCDHPARTLLSFVQRLRRGDGRNGQQQRKECRSEATRRRDSPPPRLRGITYASRKLYGDHGRKGLGKSAESRPFLSQRAADGFRRRCISGYSRNRVSGLKDSTAAAIRKREALERIPRFYEAWGKPDKAAVWSATLE